MRPGYLFLSAGILLLMVVPSGAAFANCGISVSVQPPVVNYPSDQVPQPGAMNFGEIVDVDFTPAFANQTMTIQYLNGSHWTDLQSFSGNPVGFTETSQGIDSSWARQGTNVIRVTSGTCASATVVFLVQPDPSGPRLDLAVYSVLAVTLALFILLGGKLGWKRFALVGAVVYVAISPWTGQRYDIYFLLSSGIRVLQHINPFDAGTPPLYPGALKWAYPPLYPVYSAFSFVIFQGLTGAPLPSVAALTYPGWLTAVYSVYQAYVPAGLPVLVFLLKVPMVASAIATGFLLKKMTGSESSAVLWVANPLVVLVAAVWGQLDPIATLLAVASLYYFDKGMQYKAYFLASVGVAVKVWPILMIPIFLVVSLRRMGLSALKPFAAVLPASLVSIGIYALYENPIQALYILAYARGVPTFAGAFSVNGLTWQQVLFVIGAPPVPIFLFVAIPIYVAILAWAYWRKETDVTKLLIVFILILFLTYNYVNPQYFYWILPLLILKGRRLETAAFTAMPLAYIAFAYNIFYFISPALLPNLFGFSASIAEQLKVSYFYNSPVVFALVAGVLLTLAYIATLVREMKARAANV